MSITSALEKLVTVKVPPNAHLEIEARFYIDSRRTGNDNSNARTYSVEQTISIAKAVIAKYSKAPASIEQTINFIAGDRVKQLVFINGEQQKDKQNQYVKTRVINPLILLHNTLPAYRLNANFETPIGDFPLTEATIARTRLRYCITLEDWRIDVTLLALIDNFNNLAKLKEAKASMLFPIDTKTFVEKAPWHLASMIEFELEYTGDIADFSIDKLKIADEIFDGIPEITGVADTGTGDLAKSDYQRVIYEIAKLIKPDDAHKFRQNEGLKQLSNQVIELDRNTYLKNVASNIRDYYITDKVDGNRCIVYCSTSGSYAVTDKLVNLDIDVKKTYIIDCENYEDHYYIFDVLIYEDDLLIDKPFSERLEYFDKVKKLSSMFKTKPFIRLTDEYRKQITTFKKEAKPYEIDGIVLTPADGLYTTMQVYKYKPIDKLSIDFLIKKCPDKLLGVSPYDHKPGMTLYLLFCGIQSFVFNKLKMKFVRYYEEIFRSVDTKRLPKYFPIQFQPSDETYSYLYYSSDDTLDNQVGEFVRVNATEAKSAKLESKSKAKSAKSAKSEDKSKDNLDANPEDSVNIWRLHKIRTDRAIEVLRGNYFGNNYRIAELTWMSYKNPLVIESITADNYFQENDNELQKASRNFNSYVKSKIFEQFKSTESVMDLASGKGQDLFRYGNASFSHATFLEIDGTALLELIQRKFDFAKDSNGRPMSILLHQIDLTADYKDNVEMLFKDIQLLPNSYDLLMCNFAFHYLIADKKHLINIAKFISYYLKPGGRFAFTAFDAKSIIRLLNESAGNWTVKSGDAIKYSIKKAYTTTFLEPIGQKIDVLLPFSKDKYYSEYLVNIDYIAGEFERLGFVLEIDQSFEEYLGTYKSQNARGFAALDDNDKIYSGLYHYYCFYKKKPLEKGGNVKTGTLSSVMKKYSLKQ